jgi:hypothetical protein
MTTYSTISFDRCHHHTHYTRQAYAQTTMRTANQPYHAYLSIAPLPAIDLSEHFLHDSQVTDNVQTGTTSTTLSCVNNSEHYDNAFTNTYDNPIDYLDNVSFVFVRAILLIVRIQMIFSV